MKRFLTLLIVLYFSAFELCSIAQKDDIATSSRKFIELYNSGDIINAEKCLLQILEINNDIPKAYEVFIFNNLGITSSLLGRFNEALSYYDVAEKSIYTSADTSSYLGNIFVNKAIIFGYQKSYQIAIDYFEKGIRIFNNSIEDRRNSFSNLASAFLNLGIIYYEIKNYDLALAYFGKSIDIKLKNNLPGLPLVYLNEAKTYVRLGHPLMAEEFYKRAIDKFISDFSNNYYRLAEVYFDYGIFLNNEKRYSEALRIHKRALSICLKNYGEKNTLASLSYKHLGDHYINLEEYDSALFYYQKSLIAIVPDFNDADIFHNPPVDSSLFDIRLLDNLKSKAIALELYAGEQEDQAIELKTLYAGFQTIDLALQLIDRIRNNYLTEESRIYLAGNEKETYVFAAHLTYRLFALTGDLSLGEKVYAIAQRAKAAVLRNEITENELLYSAAMPDSLREVRNILSANIAAYNNLILGETRKIKPDSNKISLWKDALFEMNRDREKVNEAIAGAYPQYNELFKKTEPVSLAGIQKHLKRNEVVVDYLLSNRNDSGKRKLFTFLITRNNFEFHETGLDSQFIINAEAIRSGETQYQRTPGTNDSFRHHTAALNYMYKNLIHPVSDHFKGKGLIIIPDEEIAWLPFDAFLQKLPQSGQNDYEGLRYLINDYTISYAYSSSLVSGSRKRLKRGEELFAFSPGYTDSTIDGINIVKLRGAENEIESIFRYFTGKKFTGNEATETNFRNALQNPAIFHLAMHSVSDSVNSRYSYLLFDTEKDTAEDGKLFYYEISLTRIASPMVVLSACNSGTGTLYHGEGLMSLARGFILAGASSVVKTSWEVNDEVSATIITKFYYYLSEGKAKDEAMRLAKLDFIGSNPPSLANPYYWAAYEVLGDNVPLVNKYNPAFLLIIVGALVCGAVVIYFRRRRIFSARSL